MQSSRELLLVGRRYSTQNQRTCYNILARSRDSSLTSEDAGRSGFAPSQFSDMSARCGVPCRRENRHRWLRPDEVDKMPAPPGILSLLPVVLKSHLH